MNFLLQRQSASFYNFFYSELFRIENQNELINELTKNPASLILIQKKGEFEPEAELENIRLTKFITFIHKNYHVDYSTQNFIFYKKN
jgi:hypothetical protein